MGNETSTPPIVPLWYESKNGTASDFYAHSLVSCFKRSQRRGTDSSECIEGAPSFTDGMLVSLSVAFVLSPSGPQVHMFFFYMVSFVRFRITFVSTDTYSPLLPLLHFLHSNTTSMCICRSSHLLARQGEDLLWLLFRQWTSADF